MKEVLFGAHAVYIWSAYGISLIILLWTALTPWLRQRQLSRRWRQPEERS